MAGRSGAELQRGAVGLTEVLFQSITHMAPAVAVALSIGAATSFAGGQTPLAVVFALIACLFTAYSIGRARPAPAQSPAACTPTSARASGRSSAG